VGNKQKGPAPLKIAILLDEENFHRYAGEERLPPEFRLGFFGNRLPEEEKIAAFDPDVIVADPMTPVEERLIQKTPRLRLIQSQGVGFHLFDLKAARSRGIPVCNCAGANAGAVAEQAVLLMLALLRNLKEFDRMVFEGGQAQAKMRCFCGGVRELGTCHVGILGLGACGRATAELLRAFGSRVSYWNRSPKQETKLDCLPFEQLLAECDILSVHLAVTGETTKLIGEREFRLMKPGALLINTARGEIVDQQALREALESGRLAGAGMDTLSPEPVMPDHPLLQMSPALRERVVLSPHIGGITEGSFRRYYDLIWDNVLRVAGGKELRNVVN
jgi:phosphoglycerate dehydrogenase-like enzyme